MDMTAIYIDHDAEQVVDVERPPDARHWITRGSLAYVAAWLVGLALKPAGVTSADSEAAIVGNYVDHRVASIAQVLLVHAVAAAAVFVFAIGVARFAESSRRTRVAGWGRGTAAVIIVASLVQAVLGVVMIATAGSVGPSTARGLLVGIERLDAVKLVALAGLCGVGLVLARRGLLARWTAWVAAAAIVCLSLAAIALAGIASVLAPMAAPALVLLLLWAGGVGFTVRRIGA